MESASAGYRDDRDLRERNRLLNSSAANLQTIAAIEHLICEPVHLRVPKEIDQCRTENSNGNGARQGISPQVPIQRGWRTDEQDQRDRAQPNPALEQDGVFKRDGPHLDSPARDL